MMKNQIKLTTEQKNYLKYQAYLELARRDFWIYCQLMNSDFYKSDRKYLKSLCNKLQEWYENKDKKYLVINMPPRHGKSYTMQMFCSWIFGKNKDEKIMTASYNERLALNFARFVRNTIQEEKTEPNITVYNDVFPNTKIKYGEAAANLWALEGAYSSYLATSPTGTATGFGASLIIIDDIIKNSYEAHNAKTLEDRWAWFTNTMMTRLEKGGKVLLIATRWANDDLSGRIIREYPEVEIITEKALQNEDTKEMLCDEILDYQSYIDLLNLAFDKNTTIANYQQITIDAVNKTYHKDFEEYDLRTDKKLKDLLENAWEIYSYCDTADEGNDWLCNIIFYVDRILRKVYILDVYYTQQPMEITEVQVAEELINHKVYKAVIESNNGGRGFARAVKRNLEEKQFYNTNIEWFTQTKNKLTRINTNANFCMDFMIFPKNWQVLFPDFYRDLQKIQITGASLHDDCADALTGVAELSQKLLDIPVINDQE